ncbi:PLP-dependent aminotransferase family protein [Hansschlegelia zhihuaiae]|uniref:PLP-dependent aminotransferase family protein n=1 Tax=Hansschlegelia zhihuaiae TaxID=405005 RepID=A0A4Q0MGP9_9HYPH|nr:PLP-dependent aminotransferase family protein [Hansschlegelia zhihuaiae]RXF72650.1 PLP-dependent aminotransferase family protein [Hansschlegelia zhihuaiae]
MDWTPDLSLSDRPRYLAIAERIAADIKSGRLAVGDRLPPQRALAKRLGMDFTTVARGYVEAKRRGLVDSRVGQGTFVTGARTATALRASARLSADLTMNLPPEPTDPDLIEMMREGLIEVSRDLVARLRYQGFGGSPADKDAASSWLGRRALVPSQDRLFVTPGAHAALLGILSILAKSGEIVLCEAITYPGLRAVAAQLGIRLVGLQMDDDGVTPEALDEACRRHAPKAIYLNPTLQNPTTLTISEGRRAELAAVARGYELPIVEDDAYGFIPTCKISPFAAIAPDLTWHVAGLAKCIGAGLRAAYVVAPSARAAWPFAAAARAANVMASPLTVSLATRWIEDGAADAILRFIREETAARQKLAAEIMPRGSYRSDPLSFNLWIPLPAPWNRASFAGHLRETGIGVVASDAFNAGAAPIEAVRVCIGGPSTRSEIKRALEFIAHALEEPPELASAYI